MVCGMHRLECSAGGLKLWECAVDLAHFLCQRFGITSLDAQSGSAVPSRVLELGCGQGLPGMLMLLAGSEVHFQVNPPIHIDRMYALTALVAGLRGKRPSLAHCNLLCWQCRTTMRGS